jgi:hypothetical protein
MKFSIKCPQEPPIRPSRRVETNVVSLSKVVETLQKLSLGINIIKICLIVATIGSMILSPTLSSTIADTIQSLSNQSSIHASPLFTTTYTHVIAGPINLDQIQHETITVIADITPMTDEQQANFPNAASETASDMVVKLLNNLSKFIYVKNLYRKVQ